ncbi:MEDS domain-containing protein [Polluticoccus soli]|uniref:MEDS domain-containing protein n=1 Tax=Polluticoccus soli TaxID=3034150 RepID=UPI0023E14B52|nr:MEDS domain-containing protein [Flavipsychrobacter sp. JY13-12]
MQQLTLGGWTRASADRFWGELAQTDHVLQVYTSDEVLLDALTGFVGTGINSGDCVVIIATAQHLNGLDARLRDLGIHPSSLISDDRYIPLVADIMLDRIMVDGMPDPLRLRALIDSLLYRARLRGRKVRFFGEMAPLLWEEGKTEAAARLEELATAISTAEQFSVFCAYPESALAPNKATSIRQLCSCHSKVIGGSELQMQRVHYRISS